MSSWHFNPLFTVCHIDLLSLIYIEMWSGGGSFLKNSHGLFMETLNSHGKSRETPYKADINVNILFTCSLPQHCIVCCCVLNILFVFIILDEASFYI